MIKLKTGVKRTLLFLFLCLGLFLAVLTYRNQLISDIPIQHAPVLVDLVRGIRHTMAVYREDPERPGVLASEQNLGIFYSFQGDGLTGYTDPAAGICSARTDRTFGYLLVRRTEKGIEYRRLKAGQAVQIGDYTITAERENGGWHVVVFLPWEGDSHF